MDDLLKVFKRYEGLTKDLFDFIYHYNAETFVSKPFRKPSSDALKLKVRCFVKSIAKKNQEKSTNFFNPTICWHCRRKTNLLQGFQTLGSVGRCLCLSVYLSLSHSFLSLPSPLTNPSLCHCIWGLNWERERERRGKERKDTVRDKKEKDKGHRDRKRDF